MKIILTSLHARQGLDFRIGGRESKFGTPAAALVA
jgi:hypothetical protein